MDAGGHQRGWGGSCDVNELLLPQWGCAGEMELVLQSTAFNPLIEALYVTQHLSCFSF